MSTTTDELPEYAVTVAVCGDPQPVIDELTERLEAQTAPQIMTWLLVRSEGETEPEQPDQPDDEPDEDEPAEGEQTDQSDETSGADDD